MDYSRSICVMEEVYAETDNKFLPRILRSVRANALFVPFDLHDAAIKPSSFETFVKRQFIYKILYSISIRSGLQRKKCLKLFQTH